MSTNKDLDKQFDGFVTELGEKLSEPYQQYLQNIDHIDVSNLKHTPIEDLAKATFNAWKPWDTRLYLALAGKGDYKNIPNQLSAALFNHSKVELDYISVRDKEHCFICVEIYLNAAAEEFNKYNEAKERDAESNPEVDEYGCINKEFLRGELDNTSLASPPSPHLIEVPENPFTRGEDPNAPQPVWVLKATAHIELVAHSDYWSACVTCHKNNEVKTKLLSTVIRHKYLSSLMCSAMHVLFGNKNQGNEPMDYMDGFRQLLAGEKNFQKFFENKIKIEQEVLSFIKILQKITLFLPILIVLVGLVLQGINDITYIYISIAILLGGQILCPLFIKYFSSREQQLRIESILK